MRFNVPISIVPASDGAVAVGRPGRMKSVRRIAAPTRESTSVISFIRWMFYAFVFSLPFETIAVGPLEPPTILGALLLFSVLLQPGLFLRWPPKAFWCFLIYFYLFVALGAFELTEHRAESLRDMFLLLQLTVLCWIAYNLMRDERVAKGALMTLVIACLILSVLQVTGIASRATDVGAKAERVTALGFHPNNLARILTLGLLALVGLTYGRSKSLVKPRFLIWPLVAIIGIAVVQTGSRGGLLALCVGLMVFVLRGGTFLSKLRNIVGILLVLIFFIWVGFQFEGTRLRFEKTLEEGDMARREEIYPSAWQMFTEKPLIGWGSVTSTYELGSRLGHPEEETKNPHNLILYALVSTGLLGAIPLFAAIMLSMLSAWKARRGSQGILPLAMLIAVLVANMSGLWLFNKMFWLVMAYAMAATSLRDSDVGLRINKRRAPLYLRRDRNRNHLGQSAIRNPQSAF
jgi:O-antigen ligase